MQVICSKRNLKKKQKPTILEFSRQCGEFYTFKTIIVFHIHFYFLYFNHSNLSNLSNTFLPFQLFFHFLPFQFSFLYFTISIQFFIFHHFNLVFYISIYLIVVHFILSDLNVNCLVFILRHILLFQLRNGQQEFLVPYLLLNSSLFCFNTDFIRFIRLP